MTYEDLKNANFLIYKIAKKRQEQAGNVRMPDSLYLTADASEGGFSFSNTPERADFWRQVSHTGCDKTKMSATSLVIFGKVELLGLATLITEANDKETWLYAINKAKELLADHESI